MNRCTLTQITVALLLLALALFGCDDQSKPADGRDSTAADTSSVNQLPEQWRPPMEAGTYELPTLNVPVPNLWIDLPDGYRVKFTGRNPIDQFVFYTPSDRSLVDSSRPSDGMMIINMGAHMMPMKIDSALARSRNVMVLEQPLTWLLWSEALPRGGRSMHGAIQSNDIFGKLSPELADSTLYLQIYVSGADSARVSELMASVETLRFHP
jgi:hypothetical protein